MVCGRGLGGLQLGELVALGADSVLHGRVALLSMGRGWVKYESARAEDPPDCVSAGHDQVEEAEEEADLAARLGFAALKGKTALAPRCGAGEVRMS